MNEKLKQKIEEIKRNKWVQAALDNKELVTAVTLMVVGTVIVSKSLKTDKEVVKFEKERATSDPSPQSIYSFMGSPLQLVLQDKIAEGYNRVTDAFIDAQLRHKEKYGRRWTPSEPLLMDTNKEDQSSYDKVGKVIRLLAEINGGAIAITEDQMVSDHLEKIDHPQIN